MTYPAAPQPCNTFHSILKSLCTDTCKRASVEHFDNNAVLGALSIPFPITDLPEGAQVLPSLLVPKMKRNEDHKDLYELKVRHCAHGGKQIVGYQNARVPVAKEESFRIFTSLCAYCLLIMLTFDVLNCFQNNINKVENRIFLALTPFYLEWFQYLYPNEKIPIGVRLIIEALNALQGQKDSRNLWYYFLKEILIDIDIRRCNSDNGFFIYTTSNKRTLVLLVNTFEGLVGHNYRKLVDRLLSSMQLYYKIKICESNSFKCLNWRIIKYLSVITNIQSKHMHHTLSIFFDTKSEVHQWHMPFRTDSTIELDMMQATVTTKYVIAALEKSYGSSYQHIYGDLLHIGIMSRLDIMH